jgi:hypothetical protein
MDMTEEIALQLESELLLGNCLRSRQIAMPTERICVMRWETKLLGKINSQLKSEPNSMGM